MIKAGIQNGDILIVDNSIEPKNGKIVIAAVNGELTIKRLQLKNKKVFLKTENKAFTLLEISKKANINIFSFLFLISKAKTNLKKSLS